MAKVFGVHQPTFNELLIEEVRRHPELYDQQHRVCTDNGERNLIWDVIARDVDASVSGEFAKKRWLQMRDRYRKELRQLLSIRKQPKWPYFDRLTWLNPYLKDTRRESLKGICDLVPLDDEVSESSGEKYSASSDDFAIGDTKGLGSILERFMSGDLLTRPNLLLREPTSPISADVSGVEDDKQELVDTTTTTTSTSSLSSAGQTTGRSFSPTGEGEFSPHLSYPSSRPRHLPYLVRRGGGVKHRRAHQSSPAVVPTMVSITTAVNSLLDSKLRWEGVSDPAVQKIGPSKEPGDSLGSEQAAENTIYESLARKSEKLEGAIFSPRMPLKKSPSCCDEQAAQTLGPGSTAELDSVVEKDKSSRHLLSFGCLKDLHPLNRLDEEEEDLLFARLLTIRLRKLSTKDRRMIRMKITEWIDEVENKMEEGECQRI